MKGWFVALHDLFHQLRGPLIVPKHRMRTRGNTHHVNVRLANTEQLIRQFDAPIELPSIECSFEISLADQFAYFRFEALPLGKQFLPPLSFSGHQSYAECLLKNSFKVSGIGPLEEAAIGIPAKSSNEKPRKTSGQGITVPISAVENRAVQNP